MVITLSFNQKRIGAGILFVLGMLSLANHHFAWGVVGQHSKEVMILVFVVMFIYIYRVGPTLEEVQEYRDKKDREANVSAGSRSWMYFLVILIVMVAYALMGPIAGLAKGEPVQREEWIELIVGETLVVVAGVLGWRYFRKLRSLDTDRK